MRIGIDIRSLSAKKRTGVEEYIYNLLPALFRTGSEDEFVLFYNSYREPLPNDIRNFKEFPNVEIAEFRWPSKLLNMSLWSIHFPYLDNLLGDLDILFFPNITFSSVSKTTPYVVTFHDLSFELSPHFFNFYRRLWHYLVNPRRKAQEAAKIITVSQSTAEDIKNLYGIASKKIYPIYLGLSQLFLEKKNKVNNYPTSNNTFLSLGFSPTAVPLHIQKKKEDMVRNRYQLPEGPIILYFGTIEPRKNIPSLIKAFNLYKKRSNSPINLVIAGARGWSYDEVFLEALKSPFKNNIYFPGEIANSDKPLLYKTASVFVFPSFFEGFGLPPLEALASGVPVICSAGTSLLEVFGDHAILVNPHDIGELAWAIERVVTDEALRESLITEGKKYAQKFSWDKAAAKTLAVLHEAANGS